MKKVEIDERLKADTICMGHINGQLLLLMNNSLVPWFILLPNTTEIELFKLAETERDILEKNIDLLSEFLLENFKVEKLNVATIGNVVSQMHIHVVGRHKNDFCWPGVVWGRPERESYGASQVDAILNLLRHDFGDSFQE